MTNISEAALLPDKAELTRFWAFVHTRKFGACAALVSLAVVTLYVFLGTPYHDFLYNDMQNYWLRAIDRLNGYATEEPQYMAWPPGYHIFLAEFFRGLQWLGLENWVSLETGLTINILAFAGSVYALQRLAVKWFRRPGLILTVVLLYGLGFPSLYFHAFLLPDNLAASLMVMAIAAIVCLRGWKAPVIAALLFGFATIIRPSIGPYGLAFVLFYFMQWRFSYAFIARAAVFSAVFFILIAGAAAEVSRVSNGKVTGISISGGLDFFIANSRYHRVDLNYDGWHNFVVVPAVSFQPENGRFYSKTPYYEQGYYYELGWEFIKHNPERLLKNFEHVTDLFFADMLPSKPEAPGYSFFRPVWDGFKFIMLLSMVLYLWLWRGVEKEHWPLLAFLLSTIGLTMLVSYLFTGEPRYTYSIIFVFYLLFLKVIECFLDDWPRWKKAFLPFAATLALGTGTAGATLLLLEPDYPSTLQMDVIPWDAPGTQAAQHYEVGRILFPYQEKAVLQHADLKQPRLTRPAKITLRTNFTITGSGPLSVWFDICSSWRYQIVIDGRPWSPGANVPVDYFLETNISAFLDPGAHTLEVIFDYTPRPAAGFAISYNYHDKSNWRVRETLGISSDRVRFSLPQSTASP